MKKGLIGLSTFLAFLLLAYVLGPRPFFDQITPEIESINIPIEELDLWIAEKESKFTNLKPYNEARIVWADSIRKTEWAIVYLHGFSASIREGFPVHESIARQFGMNLYLARIDDHGIDSRESFLNITPVSLMETAKEALAIGQLIGEKVLLMSCSTGGTYSIYLAANHPEMVDALVLYSPNIEIYDSNAKLLTGPWGLQIGKAILDDYRVINQNIGNIKEQYTTSVYRTEGLIALQALLDQTMHQKVFEQINQPVFLGYYYKNEEEQDKVVSVAAMKKFAESIQTSESDKYQVAFPNSGNHVICSDLYSSDYQGVISETAKFLTDNLGLERLNIESEMSENE